MVLSMAPDPKQLLFQATRRWLEATIELGDAKAEYDRVYSLLVTKPSPAERRASVISESRDNLKRVGTGSDEAASTISPKPAPDPKSILSSSEESENGRPANTPVSSGKGSSQSPVTTSKTPHDDSEFLDLRVKVRLDLRNIHPDGCKISQILSEMPMSRAMLDEILDSLRKERVIDDFGSDHWTHLLKDKDS
jgi:hypothetical protein